MTVTGMRRAVAAATSISDGRAQLRVGGDHVGVDAILQQAEQDIVLAHRGEKLVLGHGVERIGIPIHLGHAAQALDRAACYGLRDEDA